MTILIISVTVSVLGFLVSIFVVNNNITKDKIERAKKEGEQENEIQHLKEALGRAFKGISDCSDKQQKDSEVLNKVAFTTEHILQSMDELKESIKNIEREKRRRKDDIDEG